LSKSRRFITVWFSPSQKLLPSASVSRVLLELKLLVIPLLTEVSISERDVNDEEEVLLLLLLLLWMMLVLPLLLLLLLLEISGNASRPPTPKPDPSSEAKKCFQSSSVILMFVLRAMSRINSF